MVSGSPSGLDEFGEFLRARGLSFDLQGIVPHSGDKIWQYSTSAIGVRVAADRGFVWSVQIADIAGWPAEWYSAGELRELLTGNDSGWPSEQGERINAEIQFVEEYWAPIVQAFGSNKRQETHTRLKLLRKQRNERRWRA